ncbi:MAG: iron-containing alcohol dehydrogenase [Collinsella sp.]
MNGYTFFAPTRVLFGAGKLSELGAQKLPGTKALIVTTGGNSVKRFGYLERVEAELDRAGVAHELFDRIEPNPLRETVNAGGWMACAPMAATLCWHSAAARSWTAARASARWRQTRTRMPRATSAPVTFGTL